MGAHRTNDARYQDAVLGYLYEITEALRPFGILARLTIAQEYGLVALDEESVEKAVNNVAKAFWRNS